MAPPDALMKGQMAVFGAGERSVYDKVKPVLEASFSNVMYTGGIGTAMIPKVLMTKSPKYSNICPVLTKIIQFQVMSNMLCCVNCLAMGEILMIGANLSLQ